MKVKSILFKYKQIRTARVPIFIFKDGLKHENKIWVDILYLRTHYYHFILKVSLKVLFVNFLFRFFLIKLTDLYIIAT